MVYEHRGEYFEKISPGQGAAAPLNVYIQQTLRGPVKNEMLNSKFFLPLSLRDNYILSFIRNILLSFIKLYLLLFPVKIEYMHLFFFFTNIYLLILYTQRDERTYILKCANK